MCLMRLHRSRRSRPPCAAAADGRLPVPGLPGVLAEDEQDAADVGDVGDERKGRELLQVPYGGEAGEEGAEEEDGGVVGDGGEHAVQVGADEDQVRAAEGALRDDERHVHGDRAKAAVRVEPEVAVALDGRAAEQRGLLAEISCSVQRQLRTATMTRTNPAANMPVREKAKGRPRIPAPTKERKVFT